MNPIELRHELHRFPEIKFAEFKTTELIINEIKNLDRIIIHRPLETGLIAEYKVNEGPYLLFRGDIDALEIKEDTGWEFSSSNNCMHACGHDVHTSVLFGFLKKVFEMKPDQNILFFFQPAEESGGGAEKTIKKGFFDKYNISNGFALHVTDDFEEGTIASRAGALFASAAEIDVNFIGKAAHVASPKNGHDAFKAMIAFMEMAERIPHSFEDPSLFAVGIAKAGIVRNIIPHTALMQGSIRSYSYENNKEFFHTLQEIGKNISKIFSVDIEVSTDAFYPEVKVDKELFYYLKERLSENFSFVECEARMTGEDFGFFTKLFPSFMFWLGTKRGEKHGLHNSKFLPSDDMVNKGIEIFQEILLLMGNRKN